MHSDLKIINTFANAQHYSDLEREQAQLKIIDAHFHLWDLAGSIKYDWLVHPEHNWLGNYSALCAHTSRPNIFAAPQCII